MRAVTHCPACQTEFFVTDEQLNQHNGKVRCGQCLHVFDAKAEILETAENDAPVTTEQPAEIPQDSVTAAESTAPESTRPEPIAAEPITAESISPQVIEPVIEQPVIEQPVVKQEDIFIGDYRPSNFSDLAGKSKLDPRFRKKPRTLLWSFVGLVFVLLAIAQSIYFLRTEIAVYYPALKPYLVQACVPFKCTVELPKKIEFIVIDDSDMQEDTQYKGLMRLSSTLINQAGFAQAYPNLELTLTDVEDKPKLRRKFTPKEYLPEHSDISKGIAPNEEVKVRLAMTTDGEAVAGYRVYVSY